MDVNWTTGGIFSLIAAAASFVAFLLLWRLYAEKRHRAIAYMLLLYLNTACNAFLNFLVSFLLSDVPKYIQSITGFIMLVLVLFFVEELAHERVSAWKLFVTGLFFGAAILMLFDAIPFELRQYPTGEWFLFNPPRAMILNVVGNLWVGMITLYYFLALFAKAPKRLRKPVGQLLAAFCVQTIIPAMLIATVRDAVPQLDQIFIAVGTLLLAIVVSRHPELLFLLPFKALRLTVLHADAGIPVFTHTWKAGEAMVDEDLYSSMLQGVSMIVKESLHRGEVQEIRTTRAALLVQPGSGAPFITVLAATQVSRALRAALVAFNARFAAQFGTALANPNDVTPFRAAEALVQECFSFLPEPDERAGGAAGFRNTSPHGMTHMSR